ncbi:fumarate hydratase [Mucilaginibacter ginkgonis]|uniref:Fumarate hydratase n=1 Tax=Mucilaginibacter ginkgonis TaxID=2682091 RepID=A0A6I4HYS1_9SPHI|nr:fumarate hydratase [Mucilaginibacter ginkgonis]QQL49736.1 fumarate hydratase [Mucilaginibacter ginkgonis]
MYTRPLALYLSVLTLLLTQACSFNPPLQQKGEAVVQGIWQQDTSAVNKVLVNFQTYNFKFSCDSFYVEQHNFSKVNYGADTCMRSGKWTEYAKGTYELRHDTLTLKGQFCNPNFSLKKEGGCFRFGNYEESFKIKKEADSVYQYLNLSATNAFKIHRTKNITCIPKPL